MCDCDCELPKRERWRQIREEALDGEGVVAVPKAGVWIVRDGKAKRVEMPERGEWLIKDNEIREVVESEMVDYAEDDVASTVWVKKGDE